MRSSRTIRRIPIVAAVCICLAGTASRADIFVLTTGGQLRGELANADQSPREQYIIRPYAGGTITLAASMVVKVLPQEPIDIAYDQIQLEHGDSVDGHLELARWCRDNRLTSQRDQHLQRVLQLDPDHAEARRRLGYELVNGRWLTRDQIMRQRGYVRHEGRWLLPQEVALIERREESKEAEQEWFRKIQRWTSWLDGDKAVRGEEYIRSITSPNAVSALVKRLESAKKDRGKILLADALASIGTARAMATVVKHSIEEPDSEEFRYHCFDLIERHKPPAAAGMYIRTLRTDNNRHINRAAIGLARLGDRTAVQPLIDVLVTQHKRQVGGGNPGAVTTSFGNRPGNSGSTFGTGGGAKAIVQTLRNHEVLAALVELTGKDFDFDIGAWKSWYASQKPPTPDINTRRD